MSNTNDLEKPKTAAWPGPLDPLVGRSCEQIAFDAAHMAAAALRAIIALAERLTGEQLIVTVTRKDGTTIEWPSLPGDVQWVRKAVSD